MAQKIELWGFYKTFRQFKLAPLENMGVGVHSMAD